MGRHSRSRQTWTHHAIGGWTSLRDTVASGAGLGLILPMLTSPCCTSGVKHQRLDNFNFSWDYVAIEGGGFTLKTNLDAPRARYRWVGQPV